MPLSHAFVLYSMSLSFFFFFEAMSLSFLWCTNHTITAVALVQDKCQIKAKLA